MKVMCYTKYMAKKEDKSKLIISELRALIENPKSELEYSNNFELLIAVMLSAQCTDKRVNMVTKELFRKYKTPDDYARLTESELENDIKSCNYYRNKAKNIIAMSKILIEKFGGVVPSSHEDLVSLPGVGNKTANVVQAVGFNLQAFAVDTHILRVANRLGLANTKDPTKCEKALKEFFKDMDFLEVHHLMLLFGRYHCMARNPKCADCKLKNLCINIHSK